MKRRHANLILVSLAAAGGGVFAYSFPIDLLEAGVAHTGLSAVIPAIAPPLGGTARAALAGVSVLAAAAGAAWLLPRKKRTPSHIEEEDSEVSYMFSKLKSLIKRSDGPFEYEAQVDDGDDWVEPLPVLRRADSHPDAPPRAPLFASRDLGHDALPPVDFGDEDHDGPALRVEEEPRAPIVTDLTGLSMPRTPEPLPWDAIEQEMNRLLSGVRFRSPVDETVHVDRTPQPSLQELAERLQRGLERRRAAQAGRPLEEGEQGTGAEVPSVSDAVDTAGHEAVSGQGTNGLEATLAAFRGGSAKVG
ncbi:MAG: hypothetical protein R3E04_09710 [Sphingobium sp.]